jgi:hypothetical protein
MRVLHVDLGRELRGGQWQVLFLLDGLRERGVAVKLLARRGSPLAREAAARGHEVLAGLRALRCAANWAGLLHAHDARSHTLAALATTAALVVSRRVAFPVRRGLLSAWKYRRASRFLAISKAVEQCLVDAGIERSRIAVVYDGLPGLPPSTLDGDVIAPATADPAKGSDLVREAAGLAEVTVRFSPDLQIDLAAARLMVYLTRQEGLGSAVLMAQSAGVPVLASRVGGLPEAIADGVTGVLTSNQPQEIADHLRRLAADRALLRQFGAAGAERARTMFTVDRMIEATIEGYREVSA